MANRRTERQRREADRAGRAISEAPHWWALRWWPGRAWPRSVLPPLAGVLVALAVATAPVAGAERPGVEVVEEAAARVNPDAVFGGSLFRRRVEVATREVRSQLRGPRGRTCRDYFAEHGADLDAWLALDGPPYIKEVPGGFGGPPGRGPLGAAQAGEPFQWVFISGRAARSADACRLGSLLLHELGHLARRDVTDHEPPEFFSRCRLSACIDAGRFR